MTTFTTKTIVATIDAPFEKVAADFADTFTHPEWGAEFFAGPVGQDSSGGLIVRVSSMGATYNTTSKPILNMESSAYSSLLWMGNLAHRCLSD